MTTLIRSFSMLRTYNTTKTFSMRTFAGVVAVVTESIRTVIRGICRGIAR